MRPRHPARFSEVLRSVFIPPFIASPRRATQHSQSAHLRSGHVLPISQTRAYAKYKPPEGTPYNELIRTRKGLIDLVDKDGNFHRKRLLKTILKFLDRKSQRLIQTVPGDAPDRDGIPLCKIIATGDQFASELSKKTTPDHKKRPKTLELNWSIEERDFDSRVRSMKEFLEKGRPVQVELLVNKKGRKVDPAQRKELVRKVTEAALEVPNVKTWKPARGGIEWSMTLYFIRNSGSKEEQAENAPEDRETRLAQRKAEKLERAKEAEQRREQLAKERKEMLEEFERRKGLERQKAEELKNLERQISHG